MVVAERHARSKTPVLGRARGLDSPRLESSPTRTQEKRVASGKKHRDERETRKESKEYNSRDPEDGAGGKGGWRRRGLL